MEEDPYVWILLDRKRSAMLAATGNNKGHDHPRVSNPAYDKFPLGQLFNPELQIRMGQCPVKKYNEQLLHLIEVGRIDATRIIRHPMKLDEAPTGYEIFDKKEDATKV